MKTTRTSKSDNRRFTAAASRATQRRPATGGQSDFAAAISASPRMVAQRKQLQGAFGPAVQLEGPELKEEEELQLKAEPASFSAAAPASCCSATGGRKTLSTATLSMKRWSNRASENCTSRWPSRA